MSGLGNISAGGILHGIHVTGEYLAGHDQGFSFPQSDFELKLYRNDERPRLYGQCVWRSEEKGHRGQAIFSLYRSSIGLSLVVDCEGRGVFQYTDHGMIVHWEASGTGPEHYLFGMGLALWLELRGIPVLHGNSVVLGECAVGFIGKSGTGKSTLTTGLMARGCSLLTDDLLPLHSTEKGWEIHPGAPRLKAWPDTAARVASLDISQLPRVHSNYKKRVVSVGNNGFGSFCEEPRRLAALYVLERCEQPFESIHIEPVTPAHALIALVSNSLAGAPAAALGLSASRLETLADIVRRIPVKRLRYPSGFEHLSSTCSAVLTDIALDVSAVP